MGEITVHDCLVPAENRLGRKGRGCRSSARPWSGNGAAFSPASWARCGGSSNVRGIRAVTRAVRPAHREVPGCVRQAGRHVRAAGGGEVADLPGGMAEAAGQVRPGGGGRREAVHQRGMGALQPGRDPGPRGFRRYEGGRIERDLRTRSPAPSTRAPRRSSGWYSPGCSGSEPQGIRGIPGGESREET